jgi:hypothetical protein
VYVFIFNNFISVEVQHEDQKFIALLENTANFKTIQTKL